jgi:hypothetical protein
MLKRTMTALLAITLMVTAGSAMAQCVIGVYGDDAGTISAIEPIQFQTFNIYVVLRNEASVEGASFLLESPANPSVQPAANGIWGPDGNGLNIPSPGGENIGFAECAIGFGGIPVLVATYESRVYDTGAVGAEYRVLANVDENPLYPVHATCNGFILECPNTQSLLISKVIATESRSFGAVKSLY